MKLLKLTVGISIILASSNAFADPKLTGTLKAQLIDDTQHRVVKNLATDTIVSDTKTGRPNFYGASRFKFSGSEKFGQNKELTASYSMEYNIALDNDSERTRFTARSVYASLDHKTYGRIRYGRITSPETDFDIGVTHSNIWGGIYPFGGFAPRHNNALQYYSPYFGKDKGTRIKLHYGMDENNSTDNRIPTFINDVRTNKRRDMAVAQIAHNDKVWGWGASYSHAGDDFKALTGMVRYAKDKQWQSSLVVRGADYNSQHNELGVFLVGSYNLPQSKEVQVYGQVGHAKGFEGNDATLTNAAVGVAKNFKAGGDRIVLFAEMGGEKYEQKTATTQSNLDTFGFGVGANYRF